MSEILGRSLVANEGVAAIILAAGQSKRLGAAKQLVEIGGESLLRRTARIVLDSRVAATFIVLGYQSETLAQELTGLKICVTEARDFQEGLSHSVRHGLKTVQADERKFAAALFVPCDLPLLSSQHLDALILRYEETHAPIVCSEFGDTHGIPAIFDASIWPEFETLRGDRGAKGIIQSCAQRESMPFEGAAFDLDTPADLQRWQDKNELNGLDN